VPGLDERAVGLDGDGHRGGAFVEHLAGDLVGMVEDESRSGRVMRRVDALRPREMCLRLGAAEGDRVVDFGRRDRCRKRLGRVVGCDPVDVATSELHGLPRRD
jgi:hypothetical protein